MSQFSTTICTRDERGRAWRLAVKGERDTEAVVETFVCWPAAARDALSAGLATVASMTAAERKAIAKTALATLDAGSDEQAESFYQSVGM
jgi:hypothetical protein